MTSGITAVIPARYASQRFPGKPLAMIDGTPMVVRVLRNIEQATMVERVLVATDDERIVRVVTDAGGDAMLTDAGLASGSDRVWAAVRETPAEIVVNVQGDEPLIAGGVVDALVERLIREPGYDISTPVVSMPRMSAASPDVVTVARDDAETAIYFSRAVIPFGSDPVWRHLGVYAYRKEALGRYVAAAPTTLESTESLEQLRALSLGLRIAAVEVDATTHAVDRPEDVAVVERLLSSPADPSSTAVRLVVLDVDGVLTEGRISYLPDQGQLLSFDVKDGYGIVSLLRAGIEVALLSARDSEALRHRARELGIRLVRVGVADKAAELRDLGTSLSIPLREVCFVGDDDPDLPAMELAGLPVAPADASSTVRARAAIVLERPGGRGAVRELADLLLENVARSDVEANPTR